MEYCTNCKTGQLSGNQLQCIICGDGNTSDVEECDDFNLKSGDGCSAKCTIEIGYSCVIDSSTGTSICTPVCNDGIIIKPETCDDTNLNDGDGCSSICQQEPEFTCSGEPSNCVPICGDGFLITPAEYCDDGDTKDN